jgi:hypothetical protein
VEGNSLAGKSAHRVARRLEREAWEFEKAAEEFSLRHKLKRECVGPNGMGCPESLRDPTILQVAHLGGGGREERGALKQFAARKSLKVPNGNPGGRAYLLLLNQAESMGYKPIARLAWQCPNCNQREQLARVIAARRAVRAEAARGHRRRLA